MKPRAALILSGRIKGWQQCLKDFEHALGNYDYDIFCSLNCKEDDRDYLEFSKYKSVKKIQAKLTDELVDYSLYDKTNEPAIKRSVSMFLHNKLAFDLIDEEYDFYIRGRVDIHGSDVKRVRRNNAQIPLIPIELLDYLWIPNCHQYGSYTFKINDQFAISNYENMKKYCYLIDHLPELINGLHEMGKEFPKDFTNETYLAMHVDKQKLEIAKFHFYYFLSASRHGEADHETEMWTMLAQFANMGLKIE